MRRRQDLPKDALLEDEQAARKADEEWTPVGNNGVIAVSHGWMQPGQPGPNLEIPGWVGLLLPLARPSPPSSTSLGPTPSWTPASMLPTGWLCGKLLLDEI